MCDICEGVIWLRFSAISGHRSTSAQDGVRAGHPLSEFQYLLPIALTQSSSPQLGVLLMARYTRLLL